MDGQGGQVGLRLRAWTAFDGLARPAVEALTSEQAQIVVEVWRTTVWAKT